MVAIPVGPMGSRGNSMGVGTGGLIGGNRNGNGNQVMEGGMEWEFCFFREIATPSDLYQIYCNLP